MTTFLTTVCASRIVWLSLSFTSAEGLNIKLSIVGFLFESRTEKPRRGAPFDSHCRGHRFESGMLHHSPSENTVFGRIFYAQPTKTDYNPAQNHEKERDFPSEFRDFPESFDRFHSWIARSGKIISAAECFHRVDRQGELPGYGRIADVLMAQLGNASFLLLCHDEILQSEDSMDVLTPQ